MKKEYIKPIIINIKICNDDALCEGEMQTVSLYHYGEENSEENIAGEDKDPIIEDGIIWND